MLSFGSWLQGVRPPGAWRKGPGFCFFFFFPKLGSDGQRKKEAGVLGKFRGVPEVRAAQQHYAYLPFFLVWSSMPWVPADDPVTRPGTR